MGHKWDEDEHKEMNKPGESLDRFNGQKTEYPHQHNHPPNSKGDNWTHSSLNEDKTVQHTGEGLFNAITNAVTYVLGTQQDKKD